MWIEFEEYIFYGGRISFRGQIRLENQGETGRGRLRCRLQNEEAHFIRVRRHQANGHESIH